MTTCGWIFGRYLGRHYALALLMFLGGLAGIIYLFEVAELLRRTAGMTDVGLGLVTRMAAYKMPETIERILPFVVLFAGLFSFQSLTRSRELIVARAAGVSVWQFLTPALVVTLVFAGLYLAVLNPIGATFNARYRVLDERLSGAPTTLDLTGAGLWLRQSQGERRYLIHADRVERNPLTLIPLNALVYDLNNHYLGRVDAAQGVLDKGEWKVERAWVNNEGQPPRFEEVLRIPTTLTSMAIEESMAVPSTISFWQLPAFIRSITAIGLPSTAYALRWQELWAEPFILVAMVLFAATFSLRHDRHGGRLKALVAALTVGGVVFALGNAVRALGVAQTLPLPLAAWSIPLAALFAGYAALLHLEEG